MEKIIEIIKASRTKLLSILEDLSTAELNHIPTGFKNNLAWQLGHIIASQQLLCYRLAGKEFLIETALVESYKNGTKPEKYIDSDEINKMKGYLLSTIDQLEIDLQNGTFDNFTPYTISTYPGLKLENVHDALKFIVSHDGLHYGCSIGLKKLALLKA